MPPTTALTFCGAKQCYGLLLAPYTSPDPGTGTWKPCSDFPIFAEWLPASTPTFRITPPATTKREQ
jgi:hypothetical protein